MEKSWVSCAKLRFSGMKLWWHRNILRPIPRSWEWWVPTVRLHLCFDDFRREISENCPCWGASQDPFLVYSGGFLLKASQYMSKLWFYEIKSLSFLFRPRGGHLVLQVFLTKLSRAYGILETWDHHHWLPVKYCDFLSVPHLGSPTPPCWATRCTSWRRSWPTTAGC